MCSNHVIQGTLSDKTRTTCNWEMVFGVSQKCPENVYKKVRNLRKSQKIMEFHGKLWEIT